ncbi:MAG: beta-phosphoglucomutase [Defluviitaleaceae bacterium]|nr:beta-phosphoglucomutase [Defluviitaleaceae bacterium]
MNVFDFDAVIFDLDGVIVDTAKYHYLAWRELAADLGFEFLEEHNERLKGVSRMASLEILLEVGGLSLPLEEKERLAAKKNNKYMEYIDALTKDDLLPGARELVEKLRARGIKTAIGSASKNAITILDKLGVSSLFDAIIDGNKAELAKPDPQVFLLAAQEVGVSPVRCIVFEDALAGIEAARAAGMSVVAVGTHENLHGADDYVSGLETIFVFLAKSFPTRISTGKLSREVSL